MNAETKTTLVYGVGGLILGAALTATIGFSPLVNWKSKADYGRMIDSAVVSTQATICAAQFKKAPNYPERLKELKALPYSDKSKYVSKGGWDKMAGEEKTSEAVTQACIDRLEADAEQ